MRKISTYKLLRPLKKGYSQDEKFIIEQNGEKRILRCFKGDQQDRQQEFDILKKLEQLEATSLRAISLKKGEFITSFIEGDDADEVIATLTNEQQYELGVAASKDLLKIHQITAETNEWANYQTNKYKRYIKKYHELGIKLESDVQIQSFIESRLHLLEGRPNVLQHDDFHLPNIIVRNGAYVGVIDFGRFDWGDPVWDFIKLGMFSAEKSPDFCKGVIEGYFGGKPDKNFWELYSLYLAMSVFSSLVWAYVEDDCEDMKKHTERYIKDHHGFTKNIPNWYR